MKLKIFNIDTIHNNEYRIPDVEEIIAVEFFNPPHKTYQAATLICRMKE